MFNLRQQEHELVNEGEKVGLDFTKPDRNEHHHQALEERNYRQMLRAMQIQFDAKRAQISACQHDTSLIQLERTKAESAHGMAMRKLYAMRNRLTEQLKDKKNLAMTSKSLLAELESLMT